MQIIFLSSPSLFVLSRFSHVQLFATPWTIAHQTLLSTEILQARILEWVAMPSSRGSSQPRGRTCVSYIFCMGRRVLYPLCHLGSSAVFFQGKTFPRLSCLLLSRKRQLTGSTDWIPEGQRRGKAGVCLLLSLCCRRGSGYRANPHQTSFSPQGKLQLLSSGPRSWDPASPSHSSLHLTVGGPSSVVNQ